jgi:hypothetical protein
MFPTLSFQHLSGGKHYGKQIKSAGKFKKNNKAKKEMDGSNLQQGLKNDLGENQGRLNPFVLIIFTFTSTCCLQKG